MDYEIYSVVLGDNLADIAKRYDTNEDLLAFANEIGDSDLIYVGQKLKIPNEQALADEEFYSEHWICFVDPVGAPICNLNVKVSSTKCAYHFKTDDQGFVPPVRTADRNDRLSVYVTKVDGDKKQVATLSGPPGVHQQIIRSPKHKVDLTLPRHEGTPDQSQRQHIKLEAGQTQPRRDEAGNPVVNVGIECPNKENLRLGPNNKYRESVIAAGNKSGFRPQAVASVINIESAKLRTVIEKTVKVRGISKTIKQRVSTGEWDPASKNDKSSAQGMTQFLAGTWLGEATRKGTFISEKSLSNRWAKSDEKGRIVIVQTCKQDILDLRLNPEAAIMAAVDYGMLNFKALASYGYDFSKLNDGERAKILYLSHHLGSGDANRYLAGTIIADDSYIDATSHRPRRLSARGAKTLLTAQVGAQDAKKRSDSNGENYVKAHRLWLSNLIDTGVNFKNFACDPSQLDNVRSLLDIVTVVGGRNPKFGES